jgi:hypothetical protein
MIATAIASETDGPEPGRMILVDGFNVLHAMLDPGERENGWWRRQQRERLLRSIAGWPIPGDVFWVAFDGAEPSWSVWAEPVARVLDPRPSTAEDSLPRALIHSVYVESADDWIVRRARRVQDPDRTVVVTRDRQVAGRARSAGCTVWSPGELIAACPRALDSA